VTQETATSRISSDPGSSSLGDLLSGQNLQGAIDNIVEMGFPRDQVMRAMRASFNNADRAVEYLMAGFPAHSEADVPSPAVSSTIQTPNPDVASTTNQPQNLFQLAQQQQQAGVSGPGPQSNPALRDNSQIQQLREQIERNPDLLPYLIQQLGSQNPSMAQMLADNPEALLQHLGIEHDVADRDNNSIPPGAQVVSVTEEERAAIERLEALGFSRQEAAEAYFACDKNEELAANYLFEHPDDDHSDQ
jgi:UV excision repair protein RAD23